MRLISPGSLAHIFLRVIRSHCNIDRIYALWQAIHYESKFEDQSAEITRLPFTGMTDENETTLRPFYHTQDKLWTNSMIQKSSEDPGPTYVSRGDQGGGGAGWADVKVGFSILTTITQNWIQRCRVQRTDRRWRCMYS